MNQNQSRLVHGIVPPVVTPLLEDEQLDVDGLGRLIEHLIAHGIHGLFFLGSMGEGPAFGCEFQQLVIHEACRLAAGRLPVLIGVSHPAAAETIRLARFAADAGANAVVLTAPYYFPLSQKLLLAYLRSVVPQIPLPVVLYNIPVYARNVFDAATVRAAADELPRIIGIKDSSLDMIAFHRLVAQLGEKAGFSLIVGFDHLLAETLVLGGHGGVCGGAMVWPKLYVELYDSVRSGDLQRVQQLHREIMPRADALYGIGGPDGNILTGLKCALQLRGICAGRMAAPFGDAGGETYRRVAELLERFGE